MVLMLLAACALRTPIVKAPSPAPVVFATVHDRYDDSGATALPAPLVERLEALLVARDLRPQAVDAATLAGFTSKRTPQSRLAVLESGALTFLVEAEAEYVSQLNGRMRWQVDVRLSLDPPDGDPITDEVAVTVFLLFMHQDADDAILDASTVIERHASYMLDAYFSSLAP